MTDEADIEKIGVLDGVRIFIPGVELKSEANWVAHWGVKKRLHDLQKAKVREYAENIAPFELLLPLRVTITRHHPKRNAIHDSDNEYASAKYVRDTVAKILNTNDSDPAITWDVNQEPGEAWGITIAIERRTHICTCGECGRTIK
jgi:hypothetical protein